MADCIICKEPLEKGEIVTLGQKGSESVNRASVERNDSTIYTVPGQQVHQYCRKIHCNPNKIAQAKKDCPSKAQSRAFATLYSVQQRRASVSPMIVFSVEHQSVVGNKGEKAMCLKLQPLI